MGNLARGIFFCIAKSATLYFLVCGLRCENIQPLIPGVYSQLYPSTHLKAGQRTAIWMAFRWGADSCPILCAGWDVYYIRVQSGSKLFANVNREKERDRAFAQSDQRLYTVLIRKMCASCIIGRCKKLFKFLTTHCHSEVNSNMLTVFQEEIIP